MKILIAVHTYYPAQNGVQMVTQYIAEGLAEHHEVLLVTEKKESYSSQDELNGVAIERINVRKRGNHFIGERKKFLGLIETFSPDALISVCTQSWPFDWLVGELDHLDCRKVLYTHGYSGLLKSYPLLEDLVHLRIRAFLYHVHWKRYYEHAYRYIEQYDLVTYLSERNISFWYAEQHNLTNGAILSNAVEDVFFKNSVLERYSQGRKNDVLQFIYVANYDSNKNQKMVLQAFEQAHLEKAELVFIGSSVNKYYEELVSMHKDTDKCRIRFLTGLERSEIPRRLGESDVFVCGSLKEEYPIMLCEAAAKGLSIISTDVGHASQMKGCFIVKSVSEMTEAMTYFAENEEERITRGIKLRKYAEDHFRIQDKVDWLEGRLLQLC